MKKLVTISLMALSLAIITSCDSGFDDINTNKAAATSVDPAFLLNNAVISSSAPAGTLQYELAIAQYIVTSNSGVVSGGNWNILSTTNTPAEWVNYFQNTIKYTSDVMAAVKTSTTRQNLYNMARIVRANAFMILTDTYGDIPYSEGGQGYTKSIFFPKYDAQSAIYPDIIAELKDAVVKLDPAGTVETADVLYAGNISSWKMYGNSILLRAGSRLMTKDATAAGSAINAAMSNGGPILVNANNAVIRHDANYVNGVGNTLNSTEAANYYLTKTFVDYLKAKNDPRLPAIAIRYPAATSGPGQTGGDNTASNQFGMAVGADDGTAQSQALGAGLASRYAYSQVDRNRMASKLAPMFMMTAAQCNLLLAEAKQRGILTGGLTAAQYYDAGIKAHCDQLGLYTSPSTTTVLTTDRDAYAATRAAVFVGNELSEIAYEYWVASFMNGPEGWSNIRRTGFPTLNANIYPGKTVNFIYRLTYPPSENLVNTANYNAASAAIGGDALDTKVWWNKP